MRVVMNVVLFLVLCVCAFAHEHVSLHSGHGLLTCPGICADSNECHTMLNETNCENGLVCCIDHLDEITATEFADMPPSESFLDMNSVPEEHGVDMTQSSSFDFETTGHEQYTMVYSEQIDEFADEAETQESETHQIESDNVDDNGILSECPGTCLPSEMQEVCEYTVETNNCHHGQLCCLTNEDYERLKHMYEYSIEPQSNTKLSPEVQIEKCPFICVHSAHADQCPDIRSEYECPLDSQCCRDSELNYREEVECSGDCLTPDMYMYCSSPNKLVTGTKDCPVNTACCMQVSEQAPLYTYQTPVDQVYFPSLAQGRSDLASNAMTRLAIDETGTIYQLGGQMRQLPNLTPSNQLNKQSMKLLSYPVQGEENVEFSAPDMTQQSMYLVNSLLTQDNSAYVETEFTGTTSDIPSAVEEQDVIDESAVNLICPGTCLSHFLRFACSNGKALYHGFTCSGQAVCCTDRKEIEDYLKSLSPHLNIQFPAVSREPDFPHCGIKGTLATPRLADVQNSMPTEWCWQVAIINPQNQYVCGGALIDESWVLTAAHCVSSMANNNQRSIFVRVGVTDLRSSEDSEQGQTIKVASTFIHPNFNNLNLDNNIALLKLQNPVKFGPHVCVVCLPLSEKMPEKEKCTVTGYGFVSKDGDMSLKIRASEIPIIDDLECMANVTEVLTNPFILPASSFCAGGQDPEDSCQGDAGGPLVCEVGRYYTLVGLTSWSLGCGRDSVANIFVKIPTFMEWISQIIVANVE